MKDAATSGEVEIVRARTNVLAENEVYDLIDNVVEQLGRVDYCANCAGNGNICSTVLEDRLNNIQAL